MSTVGDHMNTSVTTVRPDQVLEEGAQVMVERRVGAAVVLTQGVVVGIFTERDVMKAVARGMVPWNTKVEDIMTRDPLCAFPGMSTHEAVTLMLDHGFRHLPVVDGGKLVGIVSARHLLRAAEDATQPGATAKAPQ